MKLLEVGGKNPTIITHFTNPYMTVPFTQKWQRNSQQVLSNYLGLHVYWPYCMLF